jgi:hypothetical protein
VKDYRDDHSPDIALLLTVARAVRQCAFSLGFRGNALIQPGWESEHIKAIDDCLKPFEHYPNPVETEETGA